MAIEIPSLLTLNSTSVDEAHAFIAQRIAEYSPNIESKRGVLHDIIFHLEAVLQTAQDVYADNLRKSGSLLAITENPALATDRIVDEIASNFRATRFPGAEATGRVVIVLNQFVPSSISTSVVFSASGQTYAPTSTFFGRTVESQVVDATDRLIKPLGDGTFYYVIDLVAASVGVAGNVKRNTKLVPAATIPYFVTAYAENSFTNGVDYENNADFVQRLQEGIASKNVSNRITISAMLREQELFKTILDTSTIGYGDPEQIRYHSIFPTASGNRLDVYLRPEATPRVVRIDKVATLIGRQNGGGLWQVSIVKNDLPGFYNVDKIVKASVTDSDSQTGYEVYQDVRSFDLTNESSNFIPDVTNYVEAAYTAYQTAVIRFIDEATDPDLPEGSTGDYSVFLKGMGLIREAQDFIGGRDVRPAAGDVLVRSAIPCYLRLSLVIYKKITDADPDLDSIRAALADKVNKLGFNGRLAASTLQSVIHSFLTATQTVSAVEMFGTIRLPNGTYRYIRNFNLLEIPIETDKMLSGRTTVFILDTADIGISVENVDYTVI